MASPSHDMLSFLSPPTYLSIHPSTKVLYLLCFYWPPLHVGFYFVSLHGPLECLLVKLIYSCYTTCSKITHRDCKGHVNILYAFKAVSHSYLSHVTTLTCSTDTNTTLALDTLHKVHPSHSWSSPLPCVFHIQSHNPLLSSLYKQTLETILALFDQLISNSTVFVLFFLTIYMHHSMCIPESLSPTCHHLVLCMFVLVWWKCDYPHCSTYHW